MVNTVSQVTNSIVKKASSKSRLDENCSSRRRAWLFSSSRSLPLGIREAQDDPWEPRACRAPSLPLPFSLPSSRPDRSFSLFLNLRTPFVTLADQLGLRPSG